MTRSSRSTREIRTSLAETRRDLEEDLLDLEERVEDMKPSHLFSRHPALITALGALVGVVVVRNPAIIGRALTRAAQLGLPFFARALLSRGGTRSSVSEGDD